MNKTNFTAAFMAFILLWLLAPTLPLQAEQQSPSLVLFNFDKGFDISKVISTDAKAKISQGGALRIETGTKQNWPGISIKAPAGKWDLSKYEYVRRQPGCRWQE